MTRRMTLRERIAYRIIDSIERWLDDLSDATFEAGYLVHELSLVERIGQRIADRLNAYCESYSERAFARMQPTCPPNATDDQYAAFMQEVNEALWAQGNAVREEVLAGCTCDEGDSGWTRCPYVIAEEEAYREQVREDRESISLMSLPRGAEITD